VRDMGCYLEDYRARVGAWAARFSLVPHGRLLKKILASGVDSRVIVWLREFLIERSRRVRVGRHYSEEVRVTSGVPQGSVLGPLLQSNESTLMCQMGSRESTLECQVGSRESTLKCQVESSESTLKCQMGSREKYTQVPSGVR
jgi:hypothetical protein